VVAIRVAGKEIDAKEITDPTVGCGRGSKVQEEVYVVNSKHVRETKEMELMLFWASIEARGMGWESWVSRKRRTCEG